MKINIWEDCWIPSSTSRKIITVHGNCVLTMVEELINLATGEWDDELIRDNFWNIDAERILEIPIYQHDTEDFVAWHFTKSGIFSVRSAYYRQWEEYYASSDLNPNGISGSSAHPVWKKLWSLKVPSKIKNFLWRCLHNALPCCRVLANRHISRSGQCPICLTHAEDLTHMAFKCSHAQEVWAGLGLYEIIRNVAVQGRSGAEIFEIFLCDPEHNK